MKISVQKTKKNSIKVLEKLGVSHKNSKTIIDCYIEADLCGVNTHGINILPAHIQRIIEKKYNMLPEFKITKRSSSYSVYNGENTIGPLSANFGMKLAVKKAKMNGIHIVFSNNNNTLGPAFYYNNIALKEKMIGITFCNSPPAMAPINGKQKILGTNPLAVSIPANKENPIILDMATSSVAKSKIKQLLIEGKEIPIGWATDPNGNDTNNAEEALNGLILPMAGYKGYGLAIVIDILSGVLSGAGFLDKVNKFYDNNNSMNVGFTFVAIDPRQIYGENFYHIIDEYINKIKSSDSVLEKTITLPGENRIINKQTNIKDGIEINEDTLTKLEKYCKELEIDVDWRI